MVDTNNGWPIDFCWAAIPQRSTVRIKIATNDEWHRAVMIIVRANASQNREEHLATNLTHWRVITMSANDASFHRVKSSHQRHPYDFNTGNMPHWRSSMILINDYVRINFQEQGSANCQQRSTGFHHARRAACKPGCTNGGMTKSSTLGQLKRTPRASTHMWYSNLSHVTNYANRNK